MNEKPEKCSPARYARTILKVVLFLVKSNTVLMSNAGPIRLLTKVNPFLKD